MLPDRVSNPGPLTYESGALPIALRGPAAQRRDRELISQILFNELHGGKFKTEVEIYMAYHHKT